jgi:hypothetical protein
VNTNDRDEPDDRRDEHEVEDLDAVRVVRAERMRVHHTHCPIGDGDLFQHPRDRRSGSARHVQRRRVQVEGRIDGLLVDRV